MKEKALRKEIIEIHKGLSEVTQILETNPQWTEISTKDGLHSLTRNTTDVLCIIKLSNNEAVITKNSKDPENPGFIVVENVGIVNNPKTPQIIYSYEIRGENKGGKKTFENNTKAILLVKGLLSSLVDN